MKILLTGILPPSVWVITERLRRNGHQLAVLGHGPDARSKPPGVVYHDMPLGHANTPHIVGAGQYNAVVFFFATQCEDSREYGSMEGGMLDVLFSVLSASKNYGVKMFALVTDQRVFGAHQQCSEDETPLPDNYEGVLIKAAEDCLKRGTPEGVSTLLIRVTSLYAQDDPNSFFSQAMRAAQLGEEFVLKGSPDTPCDFLHADDLALFLDEALSASITGVAHLSQGAADTYGQVVADLKKHLGGLSVVYKGDGRKVALHGALYKLINWVPRHRYQNELHDLLTPPSKDDAGKRRRRKPLTSKRFAKMAATCAELGLVGYVAHWLTGLADTNTLLRQIDYFILYVSAMGNIHGRHFGMIAALIACANYAFKWAADGNDLYLLLFNVDNWLPLSCYLLAGALFGYTHDKNVMQIENLNAEIAEQKDQNAFLHTLYDQTYDDRNRLQDQVMSFRDSYGRIYRITRQLDTLQTEQIFLSTLEVMEDTMQNNAVAIYSCNGESSFARLVVHSRPLRTLAKSVDLVKYPSMMATLKTGQTFANTALDAGLPVYAAPVLNDNKLIAIIMLWEVPFDKQTLYYENLFGVVSGLVQSAMVRALFYFNLADDIYLENTHIMAAAPFRSALAVYSNMRKSRAAQYMLLQVSARSELSTAEYDRRIVKATRTTDIIGCLNDQYYVIFPQASVENLPQIASRFIAQGLDCELVSQEVIHAL